MWNWCMKREISLKATHVAGVDNILTGFLSRQKIDQWEWSLHSQVTNCLFKIWEHPNVDLFATIYNYKLPSFAPSISPQLH